MIPESRPNIVYIYPDQMRYDAMGNAGNRVVKTPTFDRMAAEGATFRGAYTSYPLCCPFRASVMTGKYAHNHGLTANHYPIPLGQEYLPEILNRHGYSTGWIGKWHLNGGKKQDFVPAEYRCGYQHFVGFSRGHEYEKSVYYVNDDETPRKSKRFEPEYQTTQLIDFMRESLESGNPFMASICYGPPHHPHEAPEHYLNMYSPDEIEISDRVPAGEEQRAKEFLATYYGLVTWVDYEISKVLSWIDEQGITDNTMVIVVSDHGDMAGDYGKYQKKNLCFEGSMHVPFLMRYPNKIRKGLVIDQLVDPSVDIFSTILDICGIEIPEYAQGLSLKGQLFEEENPLKKDYVYYQAIRAIQQPSESYAESNSAIRGIRTEEYLYVSEENTPTALYDLKEDPQELNNLIDDIVHTDRIRRFDKMLTQKMQELGDSWDVGNPDPIPDYQTHADGMIYGRSVYKKALLCN